MLWRMKTPRIDDVLASRLKAVLKNILWPHVLFCQFVNDLDIHICSLKLHVFHKYLCQLLPTNQKKTHYYYLL